MINTNRLVLYPMALGLAALLGACTASGTVPAACPAAALDEHAAISRGPLRLEPAAAARPAGALLIRNAMVWTAAGAVLPQTDVLAQGGLIREVGRGLRAPQGAAIVDGSGKHLTPGLIDPHSHLGVFPSPDLVGNADGNEIGRPFSPGARAADALWPQDPGIALALAAGVTTALILPGSTNLVGGEGVIVKLVPGRSVEEQRFPGAPVSLKMAFGENPKRTYGRRGGPSTRMGSAARLRELFQRAVEYRRASQRYQREHARWSAGEKARCQSGRAAGGGKAELPPVPPKRDLGLETIVRVLEGKMLVHMHCYRADEMVLLLQLAREFGFHIQAFHHAVEAYKIREVLQREGTAVVTWVNWWGMKAEMLDTIPENAALLTSAGTLTALHSDSVHVIQRLNHEAALAYYRGRAMQLPLSDDAAIKLVTLNPARIIGVDKVTGSIERGKMADLVLWDGHPFSVYTRPEKVFVDGRLRYDRSSDAGRRQTDFELGLVPRPALLDGPASEAVPALGPDWSSAARPTPRATPAGSRAASAMAIVGGSVHRMDGSPPSPATVLIEGDRIVAVGPGVTPPPGAVIVDARGGEVTPGLIAPEVTLGLVEIFAEKTAREHVVDGNGRKVVHASLRSWEALNPDSPAIGVARAQGFSTAVSRTYGGLVSGQAVAFDLSGLTAEERAQLAPAAVHANLGLEGAAAANGSRALALARLRRLLADARTLSRSRAAVESRRFRPLAAPLPELEALIPVIERRIPLVITAHRASDILAALELASEQQIRLVLSGAAEAWRVADAIARAKTPVLIDVDGQAPDSLDTVASRYDGAARLHRAGVVVGVSGQGEAHDVRLLRQLAGIAAAWGLPRPVALAALTSTPAAIFGLADRGVLRPGARANVVIWSGDPLELQTEVKQLIIGGRGVPLRSRQTELRDRYRDLSR